MIQPGFEPGSSECMSVRCSYQLSHWSSGIGAEDRWYIDTAHFSGWISLVYIYIGFTLHGECQSNSPYWVTEVLSAAAPARADWKHFYFQKETIQIVRRPRFKCWMDLTVFFLLSSNFASSANKHVGKYREATKEKLMAFEACSWLHHRCLNWY